MSNAKYLAAFLALGICGGLTVMHGQDATPKPRPVPPAGRLLNPVPDFSEWTIAFSYPQDQKHEDKPGTLPLDTNSPRKVETTKTGNIFHEFTDRVSGKTFDKWQVGRDLFVRSQSDKDWGQVVENSGPYKTLDVDRLPVPPGGFRDLDWINNKSYAGSIQQNEQELLLFVSPGTPDMDFSDPKKLNTQNMVAYVDERTRLPVYVRIGGVIRTYTYQSAPGAMLALPEDLAKEVKERDRLRAKIFGQPPV